MYVKGDITNTMLKEIDEFGNYAYLLTLKGKYIKDILEHSAANYDEGGFMQVSGIKYTITLPKKLQKMEGEKIIQVGERVSEIKVLQDNQWVELDVNGVIRYLVIHL